MPRTEVRSGQIRDSTVGRSDLNETTPGEAVVKKINPGAGISLAYTGADVGTGDVTISATGGGGGGSGGMEYLGDYAPGPTYKDGDVVVAADGIAYVCVKDGTTTPPEPWPGVGITVNETVDASYWVVSSHSKLTNERVLSALANGYVKSTAGEPSTVATIPVAEGGTGATDAAAARTNLGIGNVGTFSTNGNVNTYLTGTGTWTIVSVAGGGTGATTAATARTNLGVGNVGTLSTNGNAATYLNGVGGWTVPTGTVGTLNLNGNAATYLNGAGGWTTPPQVTGIPTGAVILMTTPCPAGFTRVAGWDGYYVRMGPSHVAGGASTHSHAHTLAAPAHTHTDGTYAAASHDHDSGSLAVAAHNHGNVSVSISGTTGNAGGHAHSGTTGGESNGSSVMDAGGGMNCVRAPHVHDFSTNSVGDHNHSFSGSGSGGTSNASPDVTGNTSSDGADVTGVSGPASATALTGAITAAANNPLYIDFYACQKD